MAILPSIMSLFHTAPTTPSNQLTIQQANNPALVQQTTPPVVTANPPVPNPEVKKEPSPGEEFANFWDIDPKKDQLPADLGEFKFNFDPKVVTSTVGKMDFTQGISTDLMKKIAAGGEEAVSAMMTMMNHVGQQVMEKSVLAGAKITEGGLKSSGQRLATELPNIVRQQSINGALREDNPLFTDPSTAPMLAAFESQVAVKFPNATQAEVKDYSRKFFANFATQAAKFSGMEVTTPEKKSTKQNSRTQDDWSAEPV